MSSSNSVSIASRDGLGGERRRRNGMARRQHHSTAAAAARKSSFRHSHGSRRFVGRGSERMGVWRRWGSKGKGSVVDRRRFFAARQTPPLWPLVALHESHSKWSINGLRSSNRRLVREGEERKVRAYSWMLPVSEPLIRPRQPWRLCQPCSSDPSPFPKSPRRAPSMLVLVIL